MTSDPDNMGHNVVATDFGLTVDGTNTTAPGGTYPASNLGCDSCHDPHGQVDGRYRDWPAPDLRIGLLRRRAAGGHHRG